MSQNHLFEPGASTELIPFNIIRCETVLSRLPVHNLAKHGRINIEIRKRNEVGAVELLWEVSYNDRYGAPRQLAYKLDTIVINRRIEEAGRPLPKAVRLGSLRDVCKELGVSEGETTKQIKKALHQNAGAYITAKLSYVGNDGSRRRLEAGFTRYSVVFTGEELPDGRRADAVYLVLNEPYREVLNNAPVRPLDYDYLKLLTPAAQRCYEIISYRIFAAIKYKLPHARLPYSEYCTYSAQQRYYEYDRVKKQMYKVHRKHIEEGYLARVWFEETTDEEGAADWMMFYLPGRKARAEYAVFTRKGQLIDLLPEDVTGDAGEVKEFARKKTAAKADSPKGAEPGGTPAERQGADDELLRELTRRGITPAKARKLLSSLRPNQQALDQLEWGDDLIRKASPGTFRNPPGFYIYLLQNNVLVPETFETSRRRQVRAAVEEEQSRRAAEVAKLELDYADYMRETVDSYIKESLDEAERCRLYEDKRHELRKQHSYLAGWQEEQVEEVVHCAVQNAVMGRIEFVSFEEFCRARR
jgi:AraC-like DNA-binding protein